MQCQLQLLALKNKTLTVFNAKHNVPEIHQGLIMRQWVTCRNCEHLAVKEKAK